VINYNADGTAVAGQLPMTYGYRIFAAGIQILTGSFSGNWRIVEGGINGLDGTDGLQAMGVSGSDLTFTLNSVEEDTQLSLEAAVNGKTIQPLLVSIVKAVTPPSTGGGGGGGTAGGTNFSFTGPFANVNSSSYMDIASGLKTVVVAAGQTKVDLSVNVNFKRDIADDVGSTVVDMKIQRETSPGVYADVGAVETHTADTIDIDEIGIRTRGAPFIFTRQETLAAGTYKYRLIAKHDASVTQVNWTGGTSAVFSGTPS
jgi:hypothetical protein